MLESWRWFGPDDPVTLSHVRQAGADGIVSALHAMPPGEVWQPDDIAARKREIEAAGMTWAVVESIPVHPAIKLGDERAAQHKQIIDRKFQRVEAQCQPATTRLIAKIGTRPVNNRHEVKTDHLHAMRREVAHRLDPGIGVLRRAGAEADYDEAMVREAHASHAGMDEAAISRLEATIIAGLPGSELSHGREGVRAALAEYDGLTPADLRANLITFLDRVVPAAEACGARVCLHPDDPPFSLFGLPRVVSTKADYAALFDAVPSSANGITLCAGSLGSRVDNDVMAIASAFADRVHFVHLRNVTIQAGGAFFEDDHLEGGVDMVALIKLLMDEETRRKAAGRADHIIPMRPDHGHLLLDDIEKKTNPGYSAIGRLKGLAELRGVARAVSSFSPV